jgi:aryl-alcohol dehydrogenase-like predicted oxidoreductase
MGAEGHKGGDSETIIGKWLAKTGKRKDLILATKVGNEMGEGKKGLRAAYIRQAVDQSLQRLQTTILTSIRRTRTIRISRWRRHSVRSTNW